MNREFPPLYYARLRHFNWRALKVLGVVWSVVLLATGAYFSRLKSAGEFAPLLWAIALWLSWVFWATLRGAQGSRVIPYFRKGQRRREVKCDTFLSGEALAFYWTRVERAAVALNIEPLSHFGLEDENEVRPFEWHDARRGLASVAALACCSELPAEARTELALIEAVLRDASDKEVPFRLLLMGSHGMSFAEADVRAGYF